MQDFRPSHLSPVASFARRIFRPSHLSPVASFARRIFRPSHLSPVASFARRIFRPSHLSPVVICLLAITIAAQEIQPDRENRKFATQVSTDPTASQVVDLKWRTEPTVAINGEIHLGEVKAGSKHTLDFFLRNLSEKKLTFNNVKPSCNCVDVSVPICELMTSESSPRCKLIVSIPSVRGKKVQVAEFVLSNIDDTRLPPATIGIFATISRPVYLVPRSGMVTIGAGQTVEEKVAIEIDSNVSLEDIVVRVEPPFLKSELIRIGPSSSAQCEIRLTGDRESLLERKYFNLEVMYESRPDWELRDSLAITFYDGTALRTFPSNPTINEKGDTTFSIISKREFDPKSIQISNGKGEFYKIAVQRRSKSLVDVRAALPSNIRDVIVHLNDSNLTEFPVSFIKEE